MSVSLLDGAYYNDLDLNLNLDITGNLEVNNMYVDGNITGSGLNTDILGEDNTWTGTNDFQGVFTVSAPDGDSDFPDKEIRTKSEADAAISSYNPLTTDNSWNGVPTFSQYPVLDDSANKEASETTPITLNNADAFFDANIDTDYGLSLNNNWTAVPTFTGSVKSNQAINDEVVVKEFVDGAVEAKGGLFIYNFTTSGDNQQTFTVPNRALLGTGIGSIVKIELFCWSGGANVAGSGANNSATGAYAYRSIGNGSGFFENNTMKIIVGGSQEFFDDTQGDSWKNINTSSYVLVDSEVIVGCAGAYTDNDSSGGFQVKEGVVKVGDFGVSGTVGSTVQTHPFANNNYGNEDSKGIVRVIVHYTDDDF